MATVNNRVKHVQAVAINGVDAGGAMQANIQAGYDQTMRSSPDGLEIPLQDRGVQFVRGSIVTQDWVEAINLLIGTVGTLVFYERKSGVAPATGYIKHTITNPVIHRFSLQINSGDKNNAYATVSFDFECKAADETEGFADMWSQEDSQAAPTYISAARGGVRIETLVHGGALSIYHSTSISVEMVMRLFKACNDTDVGYTCVDAELDGLMCTGSVGFQDAAIATGQIKPLQLLAAARGSLVATVRQSQGATDKTVTIAGVLFNGTSNNSDANSDCTGYRVNFEVTNDTTTQLTLDGTNKIITIADAA